jgi:hypothetical protein
MLWQLSPKLQAKMAWSPSTYLVFVGAPRIPEWRQQNSCSLLNWYSLEQYVSWIFQCQMSFQALRFSTLLSTGCYATARNQNKKGYTPKPSPMHAYLRQCESTYYLRLPTSQVIQFSCLKHNASYAPHPSLKGEEYFRSWIQDVGGGCLWRLSKNMGWQRQIASSEAHL